MQTSQPYSGPITLVISEIVEPDRIQEYEAWTRGINQAAQQFAGFLGVETIRPRDRNHPEYVVIVRFDNYDHFRIWSKSSAYRDWMERSHHLVTARTRQQLPSGIEMWFSLPQNSLPTSQHPTYYKKVILGVLAVYPLILLSNALLGPLTATWHPLLGLFISCIFVSALLTYPVMPWLTKLLNFWLYPASAGRQKAESRRQKRNFR
ncbi:MAG: antibiotic biosynthesis monooxygenase [Leptodesmis sp.]|uniref:antibiotic biosynthesis monooxygenase n=1 Tax=Leptodesmis sp. TaxID=3100501 RepID=UPI003D0DD249